MIIRNKLDKVFGPVGSSAGLFIFLAGLVYTFFSLIGIIMILFGAFIGFTSTSALIDTERKRIKNSTNLFGFISLGKWMPVSPDMKIIIKKSNIVWTAYSRGNRPLDLKDEDYILFIYNANNKEIMPLFKTSDLETAKSNKIKLSGDLELTSN
ncbi:MAG: hypothetical protein KA792_05330 [Bacteroidales bacterium]|nr:hypothetical protein [Bacteroidales bacterium]